MHVTALPSPPLMTQLTTHTRSPHVRVRARMEITGWDRHNSHRQTGAQKSSAMHLIAGGRGVGRKSGAWGLDRLWGSKKTRAKFSGKIFFAAVFSGAFANRENTSAKAWEGEPNPSGLCPPDRHRRCVGVAAEVTKPFFLQWAAWGACCNPPGKCPQRTTVRAVVASHPGLSRSVADFAREAVCCRPRIASFRPEKSARNYRGGYLLPGFAVRIIAVVR
jgi:hypothetical protein